jgi:hypothetical protein
MAGRASAASERAGVSLRERLSQWDSLAALSERQKEWVGSALASRPLPSDLPVEDEVFPDGSVSDSFDSCIQNSQQFMAWCAKVETHLENQQEKYYREYCNQLGEYKGQCQEILAEADQTLTTLQAMRERHQFVSQRTGALHQACEQLMEDQTKLVNLAENIGSKLTYFTELDRIGARLGSPTFCVTSDGFLPLLARLDECISFTEQNLHYKESQLYLTRFRQYLSRALALVKQHVVTTLRVTTSSVLPKPGAVSVLSENSYAHFYGKFRSSAPKIKTLMKEIELRTNNATE